MRTSAVHQVVATQNWIIKVSHFTVNVAHQSDTALIAVKVIGFYYYLHFFVLDFLIFLITFFFCFVCISE